MSGKLFYDFCPQPSLDCRAASPHQPTQTCRLFLGLHFLAWHWALPVTNVEEGRPGINLFSFFPPFLFNYFSFLPLFACCFARYFNVSHPLNACQNVKVPKSEPRCRPARRQRGQVPNAAISKVRTAFLWYRRWADRKWRHESKYAVKNTAQQEHLTRGLRNWLNFGLITDNSQTSRHVIAISHARILAWIIFDHFTFWLLTLELNSSFAF